MVSTDRDGKKDVDNAKDDGKRVADAFFDVLRLASHVPFTLTFGPVKKGQTRYVMTSPTLVCIMVHNM